MSKTDDELIVDFINDMVLEARNKNDSRAVYSVIVKFFEDAKSDNNMMLMELGLAQLNTLLTEQIVTIPIFLYIACLRSSFSHRQRVSTWIPLLESVQKDTSESPERLKRLLVGLDRDNKPLCSFA